jgi:hypothetical protein
MIQINPHELCQSATLLCGPESKKKSFINEIICTSKYCWFYDPIYPLSLHPKAKEEAKA